ncbi:MAG: hypothetical protein JW795_19390 [Chitinivibrionales bacterium]|nr:hypothetical protein [Chitinivibrionales bacterium]
MKKHLLTFSLGLLVLQTYANDGLVDRLLKVPLEHPRVYIKAKDIPTIKQRIENPAYAQMRVYLQSSSHPLANAFKYAILKDSVAGRKAINSALSDLLACSDGRLPTSPFHYGACVYDWCYPILSAAEKTSFIREFKRISDIYPPNYPAQIKSILTSFVASHVCEGWLLTGQLPAGLAIWNENDTMYTAAVKLFCRNFLPIYDYFYRSHMHHQGDSYCGRFLHDIYVAWLFNGIGISNVFSKEQQFVPYQLIYNYRPDRKPMKMGDSWDINSRNGEYKRIALLLTGRFYHDPYLTSFVLDNWDVFYQAQPDFATVMFFITMSDNAEQRQVTMLPTVKYFPSPVGMTVYRTGWNFCRDDSVLKDETNEAVVTMHIGEYYFGNHQTKCAGTFQIYYKGALAITSGFYGLTGTSHYYNYAHQTIAHNGLTIQNPNEKQIIYNNTYANDGGQRYIGQTGTPYDLEDLTTNYKIASVSSRECPFISGTCAYAVLCGDITPAYATDKVTAVTRSMVVMRGTSATYPLMFFIFDHIIAKNASFKKTWLLHSLKEPKISGTRMTIVNDQPFYASDGNFSKNAGIYRGKLLVDCLLPTEAQIDKVGGPGKEFWIDSEKKNFYPDSESIQHYGCDTIGATHEAGAWRLEVSPSKAAKEDFFLHAMTVTDKDSLLQAKSTLFDLSTAYGARLLNKAVFFSKSGSLLRTLTVDFGATATDALFCNLLPGTWRVFTADQKKGDYAVTDTGTCLYLEKCTGSYTLSLVEDIFLPEKFNKFSLIGKKVTVSIFDAHGRTIAISEYEPKNASDWTQFWNGRTGDNVRVSRGIYIAKLAVGNAYVKTIKVVK